MHGGTEDNGGGLEETGQADGDDTTSRRRVLRLGAVGVAAAGAAAVAGLRSSSPAGADDGEPIIIGSLSNVTTNPGDVTELSGGPLLVFSESHSATDPTFAAQNSVGPGVKGFAVGGPYIGVEGLANGRTPGAIGVQGTGVVGVQGITNGSSVAVGPGVLGVGNANGVGIQAQNADGASLLLKPYGSSTLPSASVAGQFIVLSDGSLHYSYATDAWVPVKTTVQIDPVRVINTTNGTGGITGPLVPGSTVHTSSLIAGTNGIPAAATGIIGNFAISGVGGALLNGYGVATIFPAGGSTPATASINAGADCFAISNGVSVAFGLGGRVSIVWDGGGPVPPAHAFLDVSGYIL